MHSNEWIILDTETTGIVSPIYTLEIAAQRMKGLEPAGAPFTVFINHEVDVPRGAQQVHGYSRLFLSQNGINPNKAHRDFAKYAGNLPLSAYNLNYDYDRVLSPEWRRLGIDATLNRGFCLMKLTRKLLVPSPTGNYKLQSLREHFKLPDRKAHSAMGDVLTVIDLLNRVLKSHLIRNDLINIDNLGRFTESQNYQPTEAQDLNRHGAADTAKEKVAYEKHKTESVPPQFDHDARSNIQKKNLKCSN